MLKSDLENASEFTKLIFDLTQEEGSYVSISHANADFGGPNSAIYVTHNHDEKTQYFGESTIDCLKQATADREASEFPCSELAN